MADAASPVTLGDEQRSVARSRILRAAREVLHRQGFRSTVDDVASAAGVSRRTVFRYFPTQGQLLATALRELLDEVGAEIPAAPPGPDEDLHDWLLGTAQRLHHVHAELVGQMFWDLHAGRPETGPELTEVIDLLVARRTIWGAQIAGRAWASLGRLGEPPTWVVEALTLLLSGFGYEGLAVLDGASPDHTAAVSAEIAIAVLDRACSEAEQEVAQTT